jgi:hypothetical protein
MQKNPAAFFQKRLKNGTIPPFWWGAHCDMKNVPFVRIQINVDICTNKQQGLPHSPPRCHQKKKRRPPRPQSQQPKRPQQLQKLRTSRRKQERATFIFVTTIVQKSSKTILRHLLLRSANCLGSCGEKLMIKRRQSTRACSRRRRRNSKGEKVKSESTKNAESVVGR